ncbi:MAG: hypothetical protein II740_03530, partial [Lachnospiraceae bacterium]|nr:hypothetical protein [Lachnospiraceae bacterium]
MVKRPGFELSLVIAALDHGWQIDKKGQLLLDDDTRNVYVRMLTRTAKKIAELEEQLKKLEEQPKEVLSKLPEMGGIVSVNVPSLRRHSLASHLNERA